MRIVCIIPLTGESVRPHPHHYAHKAYDEYDGWPPPHHPSRRPDRAPLPRLPAGRTPRHRHRHQGQDVSGPRDVPGLQGLHRGVGHRGPHPWYLASALTARAPDVPAPASSHPAPVRAERIHAPQGRRQDRQEARAARRPAGRPGGDAGPGEGAAPHPAPGRGPRSGGRAAHAVRDRQARPRRRPGSGRRRRRRGRAQRRGALRLPPRGGAQAASAGPRHPAPSRSNASRTQTVSSAALDR